MELLGEIALVVAVLGLGIMSALMVDGEHRFRSRHRRRSFPAPRA